MQGSKASGRDSRCKLFIRCLNCYFDSSDYTTYRLIMEVGIATGCGLDDRGVGVRVPCRVMNFLPVRFEGFSRQ
jgi:hypothetical protein